MYFFNQGQALEQYYISIRNTIQLKANSHIDQFYEDTCRSILPWGGECHSPYRASSDAKPLFKESGGQRDQKCFLCKLKTSLVSIISPFAFSFYQYNQIRYADGDKEQIVIGIDTMSFFWDSMGEEKVIFSFFSFFFWFLYHQ